MRKDTMSSRTGRFVPALLVALLAACGPPRSEGYSEASHGKTAEPDYERLFESEDVQRFDVEIDPDVFEDLRTELNVSIVKDEVPAFAEASIRYDDRVWEHVGFRFMGLKSAEDSIEDGSEKLSFKLALDQYEMAYPAIKNQRFYGFRRLNFVANPKDDSQIREVLASEILRDGGVPVARASFARVYVDTGDGPVYWGLYTLLEDPDDPALQTAQFGERGGNLYEASGKEADWSSFVVTAFDKKNHQEGEDYSDVEGAIDALNDTSASGEAWRSALEARFDVDGFLDFLALNTAMVNGDSYDCKGDSYFLYGDPGDDGRLSFIPTDFNESLRGNVVSCGSLKDTAAADTPEDLYFGYLGETRPLITRLLADSTYMDRYRQHLESALAGAFAIDDFSDRARELHELIAPYVVGKGGEEAPYTNLSSVEAFEGSVEGETGLVAHVTRRHDLVRAALEVTP
jgi:spore coat protein H